MKASPTDEGEGGFACCAICGRPQDRRLRPFCSRRCADVDLYRWLSDSYVVSDDGENDKDEADDQPSDERR